METLSQLVERVVTVLKDLKKWDERHLKKDIHKEEITVSVVNSWFEAVKNVTHELDDLYLEADKALNNNKEFLKKFELAPRIGVKAWYEFVEEYVDKNLYYKIIKVEKDLKKKLCTFEDYRQKALHLFGVLEVDCKQLEFFAHNISNRLAYFKNQLGINYEEEYKHVVELVRFTDEFVSRLSNELKKNKSLINNSELNSIVEENKLPDSTKEIIQKIKNLNNFSFDNKEIVNLLQKAKQESKKVKEARKDLKKTNVKTIFRINGLQNVGSSYIMLDTSFFVHMGDFAKKYDSTLGLPKELENAKFITVPLVEKEASYDRTKKMFRRFRKELDMKIKDVHVSSSDKKFILDTYKQTHKGKKAIEDKGEKEALEEFEEDADFEIVAFAKKNRCFILGDDRDLEEITGTPLSLGKYVRCQEMVVGEIISLN